MNSKKANWAFLLTVIGAISLSLGMGLLFPALLDSLFWSNFLSELVCLLPIMVFVFMSEKRPVAFLEFHRIKPGTVCMIALFTFLSYPFITLLNLFSQFWVGNEVTAMIENMDLADMPFGMLYLSMGIIAPLFEETICRGAFYRSYQKSGSSFKAMLLSAVIFALIHLNFNQAAYAFAVGIFAVLLVEAAGSLWSAVIYHGLINGSQVVLMYFTLKENPIAYSQSEVLITNDFLLLSVIVYLVLSAITLPLAWAVLVWISGHERRRGALSGIWKKRKEKKDKMLTIPFIAALILCIIIMTALAYLQSA